MSLDKDALLSRLSKDHRTIDSNAAFAAVVGSLPSSSVCVSIGGGPTRAHPRLTNLNIELMSQVDIVGTAYQLPFRDSSIDALHCEAVLEHLELPDTAVAEMFRVLLPGGQVFAATPFLQGFHGFPSHYQNYTLIGHRRLFERAGFEIIASGVSVGPTVALTELHALYLRELLPGDLFRRAVARAVWIVTLPLRLLDRIANSHRAAHALASTTYVHARKPAGVARRGQAGVRPGSGPGQAC